MESGTFPDLEPLALAREYALERAQGQAYENAIVRLWHGPGGLFYEFKEFPAAFYARTGPGSGDYLSDGEAKELVWEALAMADKEGADLSVFYTTNLMQSDGDFYMAYTLAGERVERGAARHLLPLFLRLQNEDGLTLLMRLEGEYLRFKLPKGQPVLEGLKA
ncbi:MAG: hypothetical protein C4332_05955 [Meiothermus sp.]